MFPVETSFPRWPPASKTCDPETSRLAESEVTESGTRTHDAWVVEDMVKLRPGLTAAELELELEWARFRAARRLSDLKHAGRVSHGPTRPCEVTGRSSVTWWPGEGGKLLLGKHFERFEDEGGGPL